MAIRFRRCALAGALALAPGAATVTLAMLAAQSVTQFVVLLVFVSMLS